MRASLLTVAALALGAGLLAGWMGGRRFERAHNSWRVYRATARSLPGLFRTARFHSGQTVGWLLLVVALAAVAAVVLWRSR